MKACLFYGESTLTVPGAYLESPKMRKHIIAAQQDADCILMLSPHQSPHRHYPPNFAHAFRLPVIGVITSYGAPQAASDVAKEFIAAGIPEPFVPLDLTSPPDFDQLKQLIDLTKRGASIGTVPNANQTVLRR